MNIASKLSIIFLLLGLSACNDFLEESPQGNLTQESFPSTASEAALATNACYATLRNWYFHSGGYPILDIMSDDSYKGSNPSDQANNLDPFNNFTFTTSQDGLDRWWNALYEGIKRANVVIEKVPLIAMNDNEKAALIAQACFLRAMFYFDLVRAWGGVPLVLDTNPALTLGRATEEEVYQVILSDLDFAAANLPERSALSTSDYGRATKGAAKSMLAKVYLFRKDFVNAEKFALEVINSGEYQLDPSFSHTFSIYGQFNEESVFEVGAQGKDGYDNGGNQYSNTQGVRGTPNRGWGFNRPSISLQNHFETGDPRKEGTIIFLNEVLDGVTIAGDGSTPNITYSDPPTNSIIAEIECYNQKVWIPGTTTAEQWGHNRRLIRFADVLLMAAEASNENGKAAQALTYLNQVRARAREGNAAILPDVTTTDQAALRTAILNERRSELALEGHRFWDLVRTGNAPAVLGPLGFETGKHELLPIPQTEIDISQGAIRQNPNW
ncbi:MAG: RagB/SusD family nutrient uptake outer membrane protein [Saprospiraceae bacterium]|nr:RagB/SusD family nutrient uptake outer membrane protein [Saprospiraceae bacterium]